MYLQAFGSAEVAAPGEVVSLVMFLLFASILLVVVLWAVVCLCRICFPDRPAPLTNNPVEVRRELTEKGEAVPVGVHEIREDQRYLHTHRQVAEYSYERDVYANLPAAWWDDLRQRCN